VVLSRTRVVVLTAPSLFTEGIATRLREHTDRIELEVVDSRNDDALATAIAARPEVVLLEACDRNADTHCPLDDLLAAVPSVKVIRLDPSRDQIQVVTSEQRTVRDPMDLIGIVLPPT
jgi:DNA-binding NarL/FixJ family response regulator